MRVTAKKVDAYIVFRSGKKHKVKVSRLNDKFQFSKHVNIAYYKDDRFKNVIFFMDINTGLKISACEGNTLSSAYLKFKEWFSNYPEAEIERAVEGKQFMNPQKSLF